MSDHHDPAMLAEFLDEAGSHLHLLNDGLLAAEDAQVDPGSIDAMFRAAHSIKGGAGFLGLDALQRVTHRMETLLDDVRHHTVDFTPGVIEALFHAFDAIATLLAAAAAGEQPADDCAAVVAELAAASEAATAANAKGVSDLAEAHLGELPHWLHGQLDEEDVCEAIVAAGGGETLVAMLVDTQELLCDWRGAQQVLDILSRRLHIRRRVGVAHAADGADAPRSEGHELGLFGWTSDLDGLRAAELPRCRLWLPGEGVGADGEELGATCRPSTQGLDVVPPDAATLPRFLEQAGSVLDRLEAVLAAAPVDPAGTAAEAALQALRSLATGCAEVRLAGLGRLAHDAVLLLLRLRADHRQLDGAACDCLAQIARAARAAHDRLAADEPAPVDRADVDAALALVHSPTDVPPPAWQGDAAVWSRARADGRPLWNVCITLDADTPLADLRCDMVLQALSGLGQVHASDPSAAQLASGAAGGHLRALLASKAQPGAIRAQCLRDRVARIDIEPAAPDASARGGPAAPQRERAGTAAGAGAGNGVVRVDAERLDRLMNTAGEMVITKARLNRQVDDINRRLAGVDLPALERLLAREMHQTGSCDAQWIGLRDAIEALSHAREGAGALRDTAAELHRHTGTMQHCVMQARMVPIGPLLRRYHRLVRDLGKAAERNVGLSLAGENTELDKKLVDELADPLTHLVRNSVDHGLESPAEREAAGKPAQGTVELRACHQGGMICIQVADDGRGLDTAAIRRKAVERGIVDAAGAAELSDEQIHRFVFHPGFSTAQTVTDISGRGVGMDIVAASIARLKGRVDIHSVAGQGTTFTISLPLTLAMIDALLVRIGDARYALPLESIREIVEVDQSNRASVEGRHQVIRLRDEILTLIDCAATVGLEPLSLSDAHRAVVTAGADEAVAIAVDAVIGDEEIVVKPLGPGFEHLRGISGATILGDGAVALILDLSAITALAARPQAALAEGRP
ncbi:MAG: chemotaxis protein CheW [Planctomycetota bacterium]